MQVTKHVSYSEIIQTSTGLNNEPTPQHFNNIVTLCQKVFEPLRAWVGKPIKINSVYRSEAENKAIGGSKTSQHCKGQAMDIDDTYKHKSNNEMGMYIMNNLDFDQLIFEKPRNGKTSWIHVSYVNPLKNRKQVLVYDGKKYMPYSVGKSLIY